MSQKTIKKSKKLMYNKAEIDKIERSYFCGFCNLNFKKLVANKPGVVTRCKQCLKFVKQPEI